MCILKVQCVGLGGDLVTEMEFNIHYYVFMGVKSAMFHHYGFTVAQKGQTKQTLERMHHVYSG